MNQLRLSIIIPAILGWPGVLAGQGRLVNDSVSSPGLALNVVGDRSVRPVAVYLPPSYDRAPGRRYPVLYMLHGANSVPEEWLDGKSYQGLDLRNTLDSLITTGTIPELIVVMPNSDNALNACWYANSPALGNWEDFVVRDLLRYIDHHYRTEPARSRRALFGHSMGGFGALAISFRHPDLFGLVYASSPAVLALSGPFAATGRVWPLLASIPRWQDAPPRARLIVGLAAALDGSRTDPRLFDNVPFAPAPDGQMVAQPAVMARWLEKMPPGLASRLVRRGTPRPVILIEAGTEETDILDGIRILRGRLDSLHIAYADSAFVGGHIDQVRQRLTFHMLPLVGRWLARPK